MRDTVIMSSISLARLSVGCLYTVTAKFNDAEKENFLAQVEWLPLTSRSQTDSRTNLTYSIDEGILVVPHTVATLVNAYNLFHLGY